MPFAKFQKRKKMIKVNDDNLQGSRQADDGVVNQHNSSRQLLSSPASNMFLHHYTVIQFLKDQNIYQNKKKVKMHKDDDSEQSYFISKNPKLPK